MRRQLQVYLPVFLMALMVQILAPISASWAAASSLSDPLAAFGGAVICHAGGGQAGDEANQPDQTGHHVHNGCALCCLAHAGNWMDAAKTAFAIPFRPSLSVICDAVEQRQLRDARSSGHAQARAPPSNS